MHCPNYLTCQLIHVAGFVEPAARREHYAADFCNSSQEQWKNCKRFQVNTIFHFCPDFVLPDTSLSVDEIIDRFDQEISQANNTDR
jgi:hypothetical protein